MSHLKKAFRVQICSLPWSADYAELRLPDFAHQSRLAANDDDGFTVSVDCHSHQSNCSSIDLSLMNFHLGFISQMLPPSSACLLAVSTVFRKVLD